LNYQSHHHEELEDTSDAVSRNAVELKQLEVADREKERKSQLRLKELEIREKELSVQLRLRELEASSPPTVTPRTVEPPQFDISKQIRFVSPFQEKEVDKYFLHFENIATRPKDVWTLLLQSEVYSVLSVKQSSRYDVMKSAILKTYELVPEAYTVGNSFVAARDKICRPILYRVCTREGSSV